MSDEPTYLCSRCADAMCEDCLSTTEEYERLLRLRTNELITVRLQLEEALRSNVELKRDMEMWESVAKVGYPAVIQAYMDDQVARARKAGRESMRRELRKSGFLQKLEKAEKAEKAIKEAKLESQG